MRKINIARMNLIMCLRAHPWLSRLTSACVDHVERCRFEFWIYPLHTYYIYTPESNFSICIVYIIVRTYVMKAVYLCLSHFSSCHVTAVIWFKLILSLPFPLLHCTVFFFLRSEYSFQKKSQIRLFCWNLSDFKELVALIYGYRFKITC